MLKGIDPRLSPELLKILAEMGHGDEIVFGDSNFPAASHSRLLVRADGHSAASILDAVLSVFPLDYAVDYSAVVMRNNSVQEPVVWQAYKNILSRDPEGSKPFVQLSKKEFYERASEAYCVIATSENEGFANILIRKGIIRL